MSKYFKTILLLSSILCTEVLLTAIVRHNECFSIIDTHHESESEKDLKDKNKKDKKVQISRHSLSEFCLASNKSSKFYYLQFENIFDLDEPTPPPRQIG